MRPPRSGLFYLRANERTLDLLQRLDKRLSEQKYWDQTAFNEEIFVLSHGAYKSPQVECGISWGGQVPFFMWMIKEVEVELGS